MSLLTVAELSRLPWNTPVQSVAGVIHLVHPHMGRSGWSLQNGKLTDSASSAMVEFMLSKHESYWEPEKVRGLRVEFHSTRPGDLVWQEQKPKPNVNRGQPFAKLEVAKTVRIVFPDAAPMASSNDAGATLPLPFGSVNPQVAPAPAPKAMPREPAPTFASEVHPVRTQVRQMIGLYAVVTKVVEEVGAPSDHVKEAVFEQACAAGLYRLIDPDASEAEMNPELLAARNPHRAKLASLASGREDMLNLVLRGIGLLSMDKTWRDLGEEEAAKVISRPEVQQVFGRAV